MPFTLVGVLASLTTPVAKAGVGVFAFSTFDTDYLLVKADAAQKAVASLRAASGCTCFRRYLAVPYRLASPASVCATSWTSSAPRSPGGNGG